MEKKLEESVHSAPKPRIVRVGTYSETMNLARKKLYYDIILGEEWLHEHRAKLTVLQMRSIFGIIIMGFAFIQATDGEPN